LEGNEIKIKQYFKTKLSLPF